MVLLIVDEYHDIRRGSNRYDKQQNVYSRPSATERLASHQVVSGYKGKKPGRFPNTFLKTAPYSQLFGRKDVNVLSQLPKVCTIPHQQGP
ncbi:uncharacterized protein ARMOST_02402 [Armillaria ostoyae]|uniref:Uncharacterized protein n=1 Tax=Armillaria ostoyae TaxID=47428 RepID=A0A284QRM4_ARMOS|nr:uncharacterized protein ARMOST_02402 [Armillaria ostoyae]